MFDIAFDERRALAGQNFVEVRPGGAAGFCRRQGVAAAAAVVGEDLGARAAGDHRRCRPGERPA